jgi:hypothetical protein
MMSRFGPPFLLLHAVHFLQPAMQAAAQATAGLPLRPAAPAPAPRVATQQARALARGARAMAMPTMMSPQGHQRGMMVPPPKPPPTLEVRSSRVTRAMLQSKPRVSRSFWRAAVVWVLTLTHNSTPPLGTQASDQSLAPMENRVLVPVRLPLAQQGSKALRRAAQLATLPTSRPHLARLRRLAQPQHRLKQTSAASGISTV